MIFEITTCTSIRRFKDSDFGLLILHPGIRPAIVFWQLHIRPVLKPASLTTFSSNAKYFSLENKFRTRSAAHSILMT